MAEICRAGPDPDSSEARQICLEEEKIRPHLGWGSRSCLPPTDANVHGFDGSRIGTAPVHWFSL